jgi:hypothetical protein
MGGFPHANAGSRRDSSGERSRHNSSKLRTAAGDWPFGGRGFALSGCCLHCGYKKCMKRLPETVFQRLTLAQSGSKPHRAELTKVEHRRCIVCSRFGVPDSISDGVNGKPVLAMHIAVALEHGSGKAKAIIQRKTSGETTAGASRLEQGCLTNHIISWASLQILPLPTLAASPSPGPSLEDRSIDYPSASAFLYKSPLLAIPSLCPLSAS